MQSPLAAFALGLAAVSSAAAGWALVENHKLRVQLQERALLPGATGATLGDDASLTGTAPLPPAEVARRLAAVEGRVRDVHSQVQLQERQVESLAATVEVRDLAPAPAGPGAEPAVVDRDATGAGAATTPQERARQAALIKTMVAKEMAAAKVAQQKKPSLDQFAAHLALTDVQKDAVVREVVQAQRGMLDVLKTPTQDGSVMLDDLVDIFVAGATEPEKAGARWMGFFAKVSTQKIPGTDDTYLARIEGIKEGVRRNFQRDLSPAQYAEYQKMGVAEDPTEIQHVPGSPWQEVLDKVAERLPEEQRRAFEEQQGK